MQLLRSGGEDIIAAVTDALESYDSALARAARVLGPCHRLRLQLVLDLACFQADIVGDIPAAHALASDARTRCRHTVDAGRAGPIATALLQAMRNCQARWEAVMAEAPDFHMALDQHWVEGEPPAAEEEEPQAQAQGPDSGSPGPRPGGDAGTAVPHGSPPAGGRGGGAGIRRQRVELLRGCIRDARSGLEDGPVKTHSLKGGPTASAQLYELFLAYQDTGAQGGAGDRASDVGACVSGTAKRGA